QEVIKFLEEQHVCIVTTIMCDGMPHPAAMHYSMLDNPFTMFFCIDDRSVTAQNATFNGKMAVLVGCNEEMPRTLQMRGGISIVKDPSELALAATTFYTRYPHSR